MAVAHKADRGALTRYAHLRQAGISAKLSNMLQPALSRYIVLFVVGGLNLVDIASRLKTTIIYHLQAHAHT